jgi:hypothetical protein
MADTAKRLSGPALLTASAATVYTVPASTTTILRSVHVSNETATAATFTMSIGTDAVGKRLWTALTIPGNQSFDWSGFIVLAAAEIIQAFSGTASALTLTNSGVEVA